MRGEGLLGHTVYLYSYLISYRYRIAVLGLEFIVKLWKYCCIVLGCRDPGAGCLGFWTELFSLSRQVGSAVVEYPVFKLFYGCNFCNELFSGVRVFLTRVCFFIFSIAYFIFECGLFFQVIE